MFDELGTKLDAALRKLRQRGVLTEPMIKEGLREVRRVLLEADVNFKVTRDFLGRVQERALGEQVLKAVSPGQQIVKIVHDELANLFGEGRPTLEKAPSGPTVILMVGLQGAGKTTTAAKLARRLGREGRTPMLAACDLQRPAAIEQLQTLGGQIGAEVYAGEFGGDPVAAAKGALERAVESKHSVLIVDTAGRLQIDEALMDELTRVREAVSPTEILLVADAMTGQDAVNMAGQFNQQVGLTGVILTKVEGDARGGAVLSIRAVTGQPIKFLGMGEKLDALEPFHPDRMASRILGMGDVLSLIEKAQETFSREEAEAAQKKLISSTFTLEDFRSQLGQMNRLGSFEQILGMLPGGQKLKDLANSGLPEKEMKRVAAMIDSMTARERRDHTLINGSRKKRIARGSGTSVQEVNRLIKQFLQARKIAKVMSGGAGGRRQLAQMLRGM